MPAGLSYMGNMAGNAKQARSRRGGKKPRNGRTPRPAIESAEKRYAKRVRKVRSS